MKNPILAIVIFSFIQINAQGKFQAQTTLGINQGVIISQVNFNPVIKQNAKMGYHGGLVFKHISEPSLGVQIEINFTQRGWEENLSATNIYSRKLNYIELPFMTHIELGKQNIRFLINLGPSVSYLLSNKEKIDLVNEQENREHYQERIDNKFEFGLSFGIGFTQLTSFGDFQLEGRIHQGLSNIFKSNKDQLFSISQNQLVGIKITYLFNVKRNIE